LAHLSLKSEERKKERTKQVASELSAKKNKGSETNQQPGAGKKQFFREWKRMKIFETEKSSLKGKQKEIQKKRKEVQKKRDVFCISFWFPFPLFCTPKKKTEKSWIRQLEFDERQTQFFFSRRRCLDGLLVVVFLFFFQRFFLSLSFAVFHSLS
jgi:hypothetical protein